MFKYKGDLILSKSWLNRKLIINQFNLDLQTIHEFSNAEDVFVLQKALYDFQSGKNEFYLGQGGTSFRFFCIYVSRFVGEWRIKIHQRLALRPQQELKSILNQLSVKIEFSETEVNIYSNGWNLPDCLHIDASKSSQFVTAFFLSAWRLQKGINVRIEKPVTSNDYFMMTLDLLKQFGFKEELIENEKYLNYYIFENQIPVSNETAPELDISSAFSICAAAVVSGQLEITNWNANSKQPDLFFLEIFKRMNIQFHINDKNLIISKQQDWASIEVDLSNTPDLFPVLAVLCALAKGDSVLKGAHQLKYKESDRLKKTCELLNICGFEFEVVENRDLKIKGNPKPDLTKNSQLIFDPDHDHRMAMAAGILKLYGFAIQILNPEVVQKSYPDFWKDIGLDL